MVMKSYFWFKTNEAFLLNQRLVSLKPRGHFSVRNGVLVKSWIQIRSEHSNISNTVFVDLSKVM